MAIGAFSEFLMEHELQIYLVVFGQEAVMLSDICSQVFVVQNLDYLTGEQRLINDVEARENIEVLLSSTVVEISGDDTFEGIVIVSDSEKKFLGVDAMFVAIGQKPENEPFSSVVTLNEYGYIVSDEACVPDASEAGIFVAGDCRTKSIRQVTTATADGAVAALAACKLIDSL